uniref:NAC domain-containing protein n=1 Tax=Oryza glumipatula TaxID=40148 RepID=A0A0D9YTM0_9ORYZ
MGGATNLPPGFHFFPSDEELVVHFLRRKVSLLPCHPDIIPTLLPHRYNPWELNGKALQAGNQWYFFCHLTQSRTSSNGHWSPIGVDETVRSGGRNVGLKKTLLFSIGEPSEGIRTNWIMHEYHLLDGDCVAGGSSNLTSSSSNRRSHRKRGHSSMESNNWVLCRVFESSCGSQVSFHGEGTELSCLDEVFLSLDDYDEKEKRKVGGAYAIIWPSMLSMEIMHACVEIALR